MQAKKWMKAAQANGWRIEEARGLLLTLRCQCHGCPGTLKLPLANLGPVPEPCDLPHDKGYGRATFDNYKEMVGELQRKRRQLGLDQTDLNAVMGMADGYVSKLESHARIASPALLTLWAECLGLRFTTTAAQLPARTIKAIEDRRANPYQETQARFKHGVDAPALPLPPTHNTTESK